MAERGDKDSLEEMRRIAAENWELVEGRIGELVTMSEAGLVTEEEFARESRLLELELRVLGLEAEMKFVRARAEYAQGWIDEFVRLNQPRRLFDRWRARGSESDRA